MGIAPIDHQLGYATSAVQLWCIWDRSWEPKQVCCGSDSAEPVKSAGSRSACELGLVRFRYPDPKGTIHWKPLLIRDRVRVWEWWSRKGKQAFRDALAFAGSASASFSMKTQSHAGWSTCRARHFALILLCEIERTLWGLWHKSLSVSPSFLNIRNRIIQPPGPSLSSRQVQTGANWGKEGEADKGRSRQEVCSLGSGSDSLLKGYTWQYLWTVFWHWNTHQVGEFSYVLPTHSHRSQIGWNKVADADSHLLHHQPSEVPWADHALLNHYCETPHYPLQVETQFWVSLAVCGPLCLPRPKLSFYFTQNSSSRFNSVSECRGQIQLHL